MLHPYDARGFDMSVPDVLSVPGRDRSRVSEGGDVALDCLVFRGEKLHVDFDRFRHDHMLRRQADGLKTVSLTMSSMLENQADATTPANTTGERKPRQQARVHVVGCVPPLPFKIKTNSFWHLCPE